MEIIIADARLCAAKAAFIRVFCASWVRMSKAYQNFRRDVKGEIKLTAPPCRAARAIFKDDALGRKHIANTVGFSIILGFTRVQTRRDLGLDFGICWARLVGGLPAEPSFGILLQQTKHFAAGEDLAFQ